MGNGSGIKIQHIGQSFIQSPFSSSKLALSNILHSPQITKNLVSLNSQKKMMFSLSFMLMLALSNLRMLGREG